MVVFEDDIEVVEIGDDLVEVPDCLDVEVEALLVLCVVVVLVVEVLWVVEEVIVDLTVVVDLTEVVEEVDRWLVDVVVDTTLKLVVVAFRVVVEDVIRPTHKQAETILRGSS